MARSSDMTVSSNMTKVLVVDDSPTMRKMIRASLRGLKEIDFEEAGSGLEAIERLALDPVNLILLDMNMPDMHGLDVLKFVRGHQEYRDIPIIVLTTKGDEESRGASMEAGASVYLTKPFDPIDLASRARELLQAG